MQEYVQELPAHVWLEQPSAPDSALGSEVSLSCECGHYRRRCLHRTAACVLSSRWETTHISRSGCTNGAAAESCKGFSGEDYSLDEHSAIGLLQHYGLPTWLIDFTCHAGMLSRSLGPGMGTLGGFVSSHCFNTTRSDCVN